MSIETVPNRTSPPAILLRESLRDGDQIRKRTLANLSQWEPARVEALRRALRGDFDPLTGGDPIVSGSLCAWRWSFQMQAINMSDQFRFRGPATEVEAEHLIRPFGRCASYPQADQHAR